MSKEVKEKLSETQKSLLAAYSQVLGKSGNLADIPKFAKALLKNSKKVSLDGLSLKDSSNLLALLQESEAVVRDEVESSLQALGKILLAAILDAIKAKISD